MYRLLIATILSIALISNSGCAWLGEVLIGAVYDKHDEDRFRDGRDQDAGGLTRRDIRARSEESAMRGWDRDRQWDNYNENNQRQQANQDSSSFGGTWQDHLSNGQQ